MAQHYCETIECTSWIASHFFGILFHLSQRLFAKRRSHVKFYQIKFSYGYGSIPMNIPFLGGWTSIHPSYFDVNYRGTIGFHTLPYTSDAFIVKPQPSEFMAFTARAICRSGPPGTSRTSLQMKHVAISTQKKNESETLNGPVCMCISIHTSLRCITLNQQYVYADTYIDIVYVILCNIV